MSENVRVVYQTAKSGCRSYAGTPATLGGKHAVRCNLVAPGFTLTEAAFRNTNEEYRNRILASARSPRIGAPEDIAAATVAFLFSDDAAYINGQTILVDGGANLT